MSGRANIGDVVFPQLAKAKRVRFDWSISGEGAPTTSTEIQQAMDELGVDVAIGNYCEDRDVYKGDAYEVANEHRRTVHLGVDLFAPAGTPVYAALDGVVELFNDNFAPLDYGPVIILRHHTDEGVPFFTLYGHLSRPSLEHLFIGKEIRAGEQIATMGEEFENVGWAPHTHFQLLTSLCGMGVDIYGVAPLNELPLWRSISPNPNLCLRFEEGTDVHAHLPEKQLLDERSTKLSRALSLNFQRPLEIVSGAGAYLFDNHGNSYLDLVNNVAHVGHSHPRVVAAGQKQMSTLNTNTRYVNQQAIEYARSLANTLPDPLTVVFLVNSGSEANDLALRLARAHTKSKGMLVLDHAYHGHLSSIIDISPYKFNGKGGQGCPDYVRVVQTPDSYKGIHKGPHAGALYARELENQLADLPVPLCAFISEAIVSTAGQIVLAEGFLKAAYESVRRAGGVCIADEVQIGMGRVGEYFWGFELHGVVPDIVTMGKPIGNGHPLAAVVTTPEIAHSFLNGMEYFNTFGGNPVSAAIGQSVLDVMADQYLQANARNMGNAIMSGARNLASEYEVIGDVRGSGLFIGIEFVTDAATQTPATEFTSNLIEFAKTRGVFLSSDGPANNVLKIKPPLVIGKNEVDFFISVLADGLQKLALK
jgi:4-aminobutyrate aminotransferase-like enzyme